MTDARIKSYADRLLALTEQHKADMAEVIEEAKADEVDVSALRRLVAWMRKDELARLEQEAVDDQYRYLAGLAPEPATLPSEGDLATAAALFADGLTIRAVAKEMGISVGKAHQLKVKAAAFNVHRDVNMNMNTPAHDPDTGEIIEQEDRLSPAEEEQLLRDLEGIEQDQPDGLPGPEESREDASARSASEAPEPSRHALTAETAAPIQESARASAPSVCQSLPAGSGSDEIPAPITDPAGTPPHDAPQAGGTGEAGALLPGPASPTISEEEDIPECLRRTA